MLAKIIEKQKYVPLSTHDKQIIANKVHHFICWSSDRRKFKRKEVTKIVIITTEMAQPIVDQMIKVIDYNVNIMNHEGLIVASGDKSRIHQKHQGALEAIELKRERVIYEPDFEDMVGTNIGVNVPIEIKEDIVGVVGITGDPNKIYKLTHIIKITVETLLSQQILIEQLRYKQTALEEWMHNLVDEHFNNIPLLESKAHYLQIDYKKNSTLFLMEVPDFNKSTYDYETLHKNEIRIIELLKLHYPNYLFPTYLGKGLFVLMLPSTQIIKTEQLLEIGHEMHHRLKSHDIDCYIGIGGTDKGILGYRSSYQDARQSIHILKQLQSENKVSHINEWGILQLITQVPPEVRLNYLHKFLQHRPLLQDELVETLDSYLINDLNVKETSEQLHIHRNTLTYRLDKIKELWGVDPRNFQDAVKLQLLYWCKKLKE